MHGPKMPQDSDTLATGQRPPPPFEQSKGGSTPKGKSIGDCRQEGPLQERPGRSKGSGVFSLKPRALEASVSGCDCYEPYNALAGAKECILRLGRPYGRPTLLISSASRGSWRRESSNGSVFNLSIPRSRSL